MAAMAETPKPERLGVPSRNPLPLSASQEAQVRDIFYARVRKQCADEIKGACCASPSARSFKTGIHYGIPQLTADTQQPLPPAPSAAPFPCPLPAAPSTAP